MLEVPGARRELFLADLALENLGVFVNQFDVAPEGSATCQSLVTGLAIKVVLFLRRALSDISVIFENLITWTAAGHWMPLVDFVSQAFVLEMTRVFFSSGFF